jgi:hypothetical protein
MDFPVQLSMGSIMRFGPYIYLIWFGILIIALVAAVLHLLGGRRQAVVNALMAIAGAVLSWAFVSAYIGACEIDAYATSRAFVASLMIGAMGLGLFVLSCIRLRRSPPGGRGLKRSFVPVLGVVVLLPLAGCIAGGAYPERDGRAYLEGRGYPPAVARPSLAAAH